MEAYGPQAAGPPGVTGSIAAATPVIMIATPLQPELRILSSM